MSVKNNKFHKGAPDGKHYWLTPPDLYEELNKKYNFDFDPCPYPKPEDFDGLTCEWGKSNYVNPPFGSIMHMDPKKDKKPKKKGPTAWARKCIEEYEKGKKVVMVFPLDKWALMMIEKCTSIKNLGDVKWLATEDNTECKGLGRHIALFEMDPEKTNHIQDLESKLREREKALLDLYKCSSITNWSLRHAKLIKEINEDKE